MGRLSDKGMGAEFLTLRVFFAIKLLRHRNFSPSSIQTTMHYVPGCVNYPPIPYDRRTRMPYGREE